MCGSPGIPATAVTRPPATVGPRLRKRRLRNGSAAAFDCANDDAVRHKATKNRTRRTMQLSSGNIEEYRFNSEAVLKGQLLLTPLARALRTLRRIRRHGAQVAFYVTIEPVEPPAIGLKQVLRL